MASHGIKDKVAIVGMGCTPFGEHWDKGVDEMLITMADCLKEDLATGIDAGTIADGQRVSRASQWT